LSFVDSARHVHVSSYFLLPGVAEALPGWFAARRALAVRTSLDTNDDPADEWGPSVKAAIAETDLVLPNEAEALALTGAVDLVEAARALAGLSRQPVIKRGADGASAWCDGSLVTVPGRPATPVDTVGAGDSFNAGLIAGLLNGQSLVEAMGIAVACGSLSTRAAGGTAAQPTWSEAAAFVRS
jgi:sugar/nucleoside kinase (ribokinase family)